MQKFGDETETFLIEEDNIPERNGMYSLNQSIQGRLPADSVYEPLISPSNAQSNSTFTPTYAVNDEPRDALAQPRTSIVFNRKRQNQPQKNQVKKERLKFKLSKWERWKIVLYNLIEPALVGSIMAIALQIVELPSTIYMLICFGYLLPNILTEVASRIQIKRIVAISMICFAISFSFLQFWIYYQFTPSTGIDNITWLVPWLGIFPGRWVHTFFCELIVIPIAGLLVWHYSSQLQQLKEKANHKGSLKYQDKIKLLHFELGEKHQAVLVLAVLLFLQDTLIYLTIVQLIIISSFMLLLYKWAFGSISHSDTLKNTLRVIQIITSLFLIAAYFFQYAIVIGSYQEPSQRFFRAFGLQNENQQSPYHTRQIINKTVLSFAIVYSEAFFVSKRIFHANNVKKKDQEMTLADFVMAFDDQEQKEKPKPVEVKLTIKDLFISAKIQLMLWVCRIFCFALAYQYHDWQSVILLVWLLHSTIFEKEANFAKITGLVYFPLMILIFLMLFAVNIYGLVDYSEWAVTTYATFFSKYSSQYDNPYPQFPDQFNIPKTVNMYRYGFYQFSLPHVELSVFVIFLVSIAYYIKLNQSIVEDTETSSLLILKKMSPLLFNFVTILLVKSQQLVTIYIVVFSLSVMDVYHNLVLFWYIWGVLYPKKLAKSVTLISYYAAIFLLVKYIYTLVPEFNGNSAECFIIRESKLCTNTERVMYVLGFDSKYNPLTLVEFYRYYPPVFDWLFLFAAFVQLRRQESLGGVSDENTTNTLMKMQEKSIAEKMPRLYKVYIVLDSIYYMIVIVASFIVFLAILTVTERTILNLVSFQLLLAMLMVYLLKGTPQLHKCYRFVPFYQAYVLVSLIVCQFITKCLNIFPRVLKWLESIDPRKKTLFELFGYYQFPRDEQIWKFFVPYTLLFFGTVFIYQEIGLKVVFEKDTLELGPEPSEAEIYNTPSLAVFDTESTEEQIEEKEIRYAAEVQDVFVRMRYQDPFKIWKLKFFWPVFNFTALYFDVLLNTAIFAFAIYTGLAVIWFIFLVGYAFQTWKMQINHRSYRKQVITSYEASIVGQDNNYTYCENEARQRKLKAQLTKDKSKPFQAMVKEAIERLQEESNGSSRLLITDEKVRLQYDDYEQNIHMVTLSKRKFSWVINYLLLMISFFFCYLGMFIDMDASLQVLKGPNEQNRLLFIFYFLGFYIQTKQQTLLLNKTVTSGIEYPFLTLLFLMAIEKLSHYWLENKCNTTTQKIDHYQMITTVYETLEKKAANRTQNPPENEARQEVADAAQIGLEDRRTFDPNSEQVQIKQKEILTELGQILSIKNKIKLHQACRVLFEEIIVLLCIFSLIYKQNILSYIIYLVVLYYAIRRFTSRRAISWCKYTILLILILQYLCIVVNESSYNTYGWPDAILSYGVYPNLQNYYYNIPICFALSQNYTTNPDPSPGAGLLQLKTINLETLSFYGFEMKFGQFDGLWVDFAVTVLIYFYLNQFNFWLVAYPHKVTISERTKELVEQYKKQVLGDEDKSWKIVYQQLKHDNKFNRFLNGLSEYIYLTFSLVLVTFILMINVFESNLLSFGYLVAALYLIQINITFFKDLKSQERQQQVLQYFLLPYLLLDIFLQLLAILPFENKTFTSGWLNTLGIQKVETFSPKNIYLGQPVEVIYTISPLMYQLIIKAVAFFLVSLQLWMVRSVNFQKFSLKLMLGNLENLNKIGLGMAYRFNNFKNRQIIKQAQNYERLEKMLKHVKSVIKKRDKLFRLNNSPKQLVQIAEEQQQHAMDEENQIPILEQLPEEEVEQTDAAVDYDTLFKTEVNTEYAARMKALGAGYKIYLWLRRNFVQDLLFRQSEEHLADMIQQFSKGRTCIKTDIEIGIMIETKQDWLQTKLLELEMKHREGNITAEELEIFQNFRRSTLESMVLQPWEQYDKERYKSTSHLVALYFVLFWKITTSYAHLFCYFFMLLATIQKAGIIYMPYPAMIFGLALLEEDRPGKRFWFTVIIYTNIVMLFQFTAQLTIWKSDLVKFGTETKTFLDNINFGLIYIPLQDYKDFFKMVWFFAPEIGITISTLVLIQQETLAGIFDVKLKDYESFADGLERQASIIMERSERASKNFQSYEFHLTTKEKIKYDESLTRKRFMSEGDLKDFEEKFETDLVIHSTESQDDQLEIQLAKQPIQVNLQVLRKRSKSVAAHISGHSSNKVSLFQKIKTVAGQAADKLWDNQYFDRLFPRIKQEKPGKDFYVGIAAVEIIICFYLILFYNKMTGVQTSIAEEYVSNQFKGFMVLALFVMIGIMVVDRFLYSSWSFMSRKALSKKLDTDTPLMQNDNSSDDKSAVSGEKFFKFKSQSGPSDNGSDRDFKEISETEQRAFQDILTPQYREKAPSVVIRYYFLWFVLILVHWFLFFALVNEPNLCKSVPYCNKFSKNGYLVSMYILFIIYFSFSACQIQKGLPELRRGGFMLDQFNNVGQYTFEGWYEIPFLFELRTIIDWTFTPTALDVFQSIKLAQIQSDMFVAKCENKKYVEHTLGEKQPLIKKVGQGGLFLSIILILIAGPMLLFSTFNPVSSPNPVTTGNLQFQILIEDVSKTSVNIPIFQTAELIQNRTLTQSEYTAFDFSNIDYNTNQYAYSQSQTIQFSPVSDQVWTVSPPKKEFLVDALINAKNGTNPDQKVTAYFLAQFTRTSTITQLSNFAFKQALNSSTTAILDTLILQTSDCAAASTVNTVFPSTSFQITLGLDSSTKASQVTPFPDQVGYNYGQFYTGFVLSYDCNVTSPSDSYWNLTQIYNSENIGTSQAAITYQQEIQIFNNTGDGSIGFGFIVFNQNVLPSFLGAYATSVIAFYAAIIYFIAYEFRSSFVPYSIEIPIINAPHTEDILAICQCVYIYRVQRNHKKQVFVS